MTGQLQMQLLTRLVALDEVQGSAVKDVYHLLVDDCGPIRHAAAALVADSLEEHGVRTLQVEISSFVCWRRLYSLAVTCCLLHFANTLPCSLLLLGNTSGNASCGPGMPHLGRHFQSICHYMHHSASLWEACPSARSVSLRIRGT